ncbi:Tyrosine recombinase XerC [Achromobacter veterisilvae]|uniref:Tyrosine recombinase XerC n=1 Tax=Achromobacter veterisilvae TaxID=2069367 RepID=A0A446CTQ6_9BURK|nr:tyrosine-type recombinase/integrase [Achromobacter veterisilvae]SSW71240.1 Tyrosine recombinase XerC [Achromobacter veterisilvae]
MRDHSLLAPWVRRFLLEHLVAERNLARNTQVSYRDALTQLLPFVASAVRKDVDRLSVEDVSDERIRAFLDHVERDRTCSVLTRNQRLAALHSMARFIGSRSPEHAAWCAQVRSIPFKKAARTTVGYLDKPELDALLRVPERGSALGARDYALLLFLYNSGARADEAATLKVANLMLGTSPAVRILGKGSKWRVCPLWPQTVAVLRPLVNGRDPEDSVFQGRTGEPMTRFGVHRVVTCCAALAANSVTSMADKRISPHTIRHTTAVHLLRAGVDINTIRAWLGHASLDTTNIYAEVDLEMKAKALASVDITGLPALPRPRKPPAVMDFLSQL